MPNNDPDQRSKQLEALRKIASENGLLEDANDDELSSLLNSKRPKILVPADQRELIDFARECAPRRWRRPAFRRVISARH
jgi:hypothetical protein